MLFPLWNRENLKVLLQHMNCTEHIECVKEKLTGQPWMQHKNYVKSRVAAYRS